MSAGQPRVRRLDGVRRDDGDRVGARAANLGELLAVGFGVPAGFVVEAGGDRDGAELRARVARAYSGLGISPAGRPLHVRVRCSAPGRDEVVRTNVRGHDRVLDAVVACRGAGPGPVAVLVQEMVPAQQSGRACTGGPRTGGGDRVVVTAVLGQGGSSASEAVEPDTYVVRGPGDEIVSVHVGHQTHQLVRGRDGRDLWTTLDPWRADARVLDDGAVAAVAREARRVREHLGCPQDVEWAMVAGRLWVLSSVACRPAPSSAAPRADPAARVGV